MAKNEIASKIAQEVNKATAGLMGGQMLASRSKYWKELKSDEKIERMREIIKNLQDQVENLKQSEALLMRHSHTSEGEVVVVNRLGNRYGGQEEVPYSGRHKPGMNPDEVYF